MPKIRVAEAPRPAKEAVSASGQGRYLIQLISPGWGSSGYYSTEMLQATAKAKVFTKGTHQMLDHQTEQEWADRPVGSVRDLAAVLDEDAYWSDERNALVAEARVFGQYREVLDDMADDIGVSIRAYAESHHGEAEGRKGPIIDALTEAISVDFVTRAGRGGKILEVMEHALSEASVNDRRDQLERAMTGKSWVMDFDEDEKWVVYRSYDDEDHTRTFRQAFTVADDDKSATLAGDPEEVRVVTTYVPASSAGSPTSTEAGIPAPHETQESSMEITDADLAELRSKADRTDAAEAETARLRAAAARTAAAETARTRAVQALKESALPQPSKDRIVTQAVSGLTLTEAGDLDTAALDAAVTTAEADETAYLAAVLPQQGVKGFGSSTAATESHAPTTNPWGRSITKEA